MGQTFEHVEALGHDAVAAAAVEVGHHADATGVVLPCGVVKAADGWHGNVLSGSGHRR